MSWSDEESWSLMSVAYSMYLRVTYELHLVQSFVTYVSFWSSYQHLLPPFIRTCDHSIWNSRHRAQPSVVKPQGLIRPNQGNLYVLLLAPGKDRVTEQPLVRACVQNAFLYDLTQHSTFQAATQMH